jgi:hypothetical protein
MNFTGAFGNYGIRGEDVTNFTLKESNFTGSFGTSDAANEGTIYFGTQGGSISGLTGTALFEGNNIAGGFEDNVNIYVTTGGVLNLTFRDGTNQAIIGLNHISGGNDGIIVETAGSGSVTTTINGVEFSGARGDMFQSAINGSSTQNVTVTNNTFHNTHGDIAPGGGGITLNGAGASTNYNLTYTISGNSFRGAEGSPIFVGHSGTNATIRGVILNNIIGIDDNVTSNVQASTGSSAGGFGIGVRMEHNSTGGGIIRHAVRIEGNQVRDIIGGLSAIYLSANGDGTSGNTVLEATVRNNIMEELDGNVYAGLYSMVGGASSLGDFARMGLDVSNNTVVLPSSGSGGNPIAFDQVSADARYYFPGYVPGPNGANGEFATPAGNASQVLHNFLTTAPKSNILPNNGPFPNMSAYRVDASLVKFISGLAFTMLVP